MACTTVLEKKTGVHAFSNRVNEGGKHALHGNIWGMGWEALGDNIQSSQDCLRARFSVSKHQTQIGTSQIKSPSGM